jgi:hypothetical protein
MNILHLKAKVLISLSKILMAVSSYIKLLSLKADNASTKAMIKNSTYYKAILKEWDDEYDKSRLN